MRPRGPFGRGDAFTERIRSREGDLDIRPLTSPLGERNLQRGSAS